MFKIYVLFLLFLFGCVSTENRNFAARYYNIGNDFYEDKKYEEAVNYFRLALELDPNFRIVYLNYGLALIEVRDYEKAERQLSKVYGIDARNTLCLSALGYLSFQSGKYENAETWYERSVAVNPYNPQTYYNLGIVRQLNKDYSGSEEAFAKVIELQDAKEYPEEFKRYQALNQLYLGNEEAAMSLYEEYFAARGSSEQIFQELYDFYVPREEYEKLVEVFAKFEESLRNSGLAAFLLAEIYYLKLNNPVLGLENLQVALTRRFSDDEKLQGLLGKLRGSERARARSAITEEEK